MRISTRNQAAAATEWLPGFEPNTTQSAHLPVVEAQSALPATAVRQTNDSSVRMSSYMQDSPLTASENSVFTEEPPVLVGEKALPVTVVEFPPEVEEQLDRPEWPVFDLTKVVPPRGEVGRLQVNVDVLKLIRELKISGATPTVEQRHKLLSFGGWGGLGKMFEDLGSGQMKALATEAKAMLTEEDWSSARSATLSSFYTPPALISAMWTLVRRLGFKGGRVIEPASGTGLVIAGMPQDIAQSSQITAVEMDSTTASVLETAMRGLDVQVVNSPLEKAVVPNGFFDLVIGNVPFGDFKTRDTSKAAYSEWNIHNWFFGRAIDLVRPGGLIVLITSQHTLDSQRQSHREWLNANAEMLGAIRLPAGAFKEMASTEVATDLIVLKRRMTPKYKDLQPCIGLQQAPVELMAPNQVTRVYSGRQMVDRSRLVNEWFTKYPNMVIGKFEFRTAQYRDEMVNVWLDSRDAFDQAVEECVQAFVPDAYEPSKATEDRSMPSVSLTRKETLGMYKVGSYVIEDGKLYISEGLGVLTSMETMLTGLRRERVMQLVGLRDIARQTVEFQASSQDDAQLASLQRRLNVFYDSFVKKFGYIQDTANVRVFRQDPDFPLLLSLERKNEETNEVVKADIFSKRTVAVRSIPARVDNMAEAIALCLGVYGHLDIREMARLLGSSRKEVVRQLEDDGLAYREPGTKRWLPADEYLSGHIRNKIAEASAAGKAFERNVTALQSVLPQPLGPADVEVRLGAPWVPIGVVQQFACELIGLAAKDYDDLKISYEPIGACWSVITNGTSRYRSLWTADKTAQTVKWGTSRKSAIDLIEAALNQIPPKVFDTVDDRQVLNRGETMAAREKFEAIRAEFRQWAYADADRRDKLLEIYNENFNQIVERQFDGSHLLLPGMAAVITPYKHQLDAIWRIVVGGNTLLEHCVGAGKTFTMAAATMEMKRLGIANKILHAVPNHMLLQYAGDFMRFYPQANVLIATKEDLHGDNRNRFVARVATGDYDAVVMTQSTLELLSMRPETVKRFLEDWEGQARFAAQASSERGARRSIKQIEKLIAALDAKLERALAEGRKDDFLHFESLGIDHLMIDEAQSYKNLLRISKMPPIAGLNSAASNRAFDMLLKSSYIMSLYGDAEKGLTMSTATPIANSVAEMHTYKKYLMPQTLKSLGLFEFDAWAATFGEAVTGMEVAPDGSGYRVNTRFARFTNVGELMSLYRTVADIRTKKMLNLPTPKIKGGGPRTICVPQSDHLKLITQELVERADKVRNGLVKPEEDNMLSITNDGRKAALDVRLVDPTAPREADDKIGAVVREVLRIHAETMAMRGTQMIFCDLSTPNSAGFSVYADIRERLIASGIPVSEIAFVHDYDTDTKKDKLFALVRAGLIRVLLGSTQKMGTGTNAQKRLAAVHQIDAPWRPDLVEQRDGRAERQGNDCEWIELLRYVRTGSFDAYSWQGLETKARFIEQTKTARRGVRSIEDIGMTAMTYAEIKALASGNPLVLEKATVDAEVHKYSMLMGVWEDQRWRAKSGLAHAHREMQYVDQKMPLANLDAQALARAKLSGLTVKATMALKVGSPQEAQYVERAIGFAIRATSADMISGSTRTACEVGPFEVVVEKGYRSEVAVLCPNSGMQLGVSREFLTVHDLEAVGSRVIEEIERIADLPAKLLGRKERAERDAANYAAALEAEFEHRDKLNTAVARQREIEAELDLDKNEAGTEQVADAKEAS